MEVHCPDNNNFCGILYQDSQLDDCDDANRSFLLILSMFNFYFPGRAQGKLLRRVEFKTDMQNIHTQKETAEKTAYSNECRVLMDLQCSVQNCSPE